MKRNRYLLHFWSPFFLLIAQSGIWAYVWMNYYRHTLPEPIYWRGNLLVCTVYFVLLFLISSFYGGLRVGYYRASDVGLSGMIALALTNGITWAQASLMAGAILTPVPIAVMTLAQAAIIWRWAIAMHTLYERTVPPRRMLLIYGGLDSAKRLVSKLVTRSEKYQVQESLCVTAAGVGDACAKIPDFEAVVFCDIPPQIYCELHTFCFRHSIRVYTVPSIQDILTRSAAEMNLFDTPLLLSRNQGLNEERRVVKRAFDILLSGIALVALSPFMLITAVAVKLYDGGPVIYAQERLTVNAQRFLLYKFRSMSQDAEKNGARLSTQNDDRITPVGKVIRALRLDELPQLVNILKGDMSIVGPRPERPEIAEEYHETMPEFEYRLKVKAGLTGYAQVFGNYNTDPWDKLLMDLIYISNYSLMLDFKIMLMTVKILLQRDRTTGIEDGKVTPRKEEGGQ